MTVRQRPEWTVVDIANHAAKATSLSELTLPEVKKLAARILSEENISTDLTEKDPIPTDSGELFQSQHVEGM